MRKRGQGRGKKGDKGKKKAHLADAEGDEESSDGKFAHVVDTVPTSPPASSSASSVPRLHPLPSKPSFDLSNAVLPGEEEIGRYIGNKIGIPNNCLAHAAIAGLAKHSFNLRHNNLVAIQADDLRISSALTRIEDPVSAAVPSASVQPLRVRKEREQQERERPLLSRIGALLSLGRSNVHSRTFIAPHLLERAPEDQLEDYGSGPDIDDEPVVSKSASKPARRAFGAGYTITVSDSEFERELDRHAASYVDDEAMENNSPSDGNRSEHDDDTIEDAGKAVASDDQGSSTSRAHSQAASSSPSLKRRLTSPPSDRAVIRQRTDTDLSAAVSLWSTDQAASRPKPQPSASRLGNHTLTGMALSAPNRAQRPAASPTPTPAPAASAQSGVAAGALQMPPTPRMVGGSDNGAGGEPPRVGSSTSGTKPSHTPCKRGLGRKHGGVQSLADHLGEASKNNADFSACVHPIHDRTTAHSVTDNCISVASSSDAMYLYEHTAYYTCVHDRDMAECKLCKGKARAKQRKPWLIDSGALRHFTNDLKDFIDYTEFAPGEQQKLTTANGQSRILGEGSVIIRAPNSKGLMKTVR
jgi:hypothetical protein